MSDAAVQMTHPVSRLCSSLDDMAQTDIEGGQSSSGELKCRRCTDIFRKGHEGNHGRDVESANATQLSPQERKNLNIKRTIPFIQQLKTVLFGAKINVLLLAVPAGFTLHYSDLGPIPIFIVNFTAIIPLAAILSSATEELAIRVGDTLGGLLNASFGNAVELIVSIQALIKNEIVIVKTSLIGGMNRPEQFFNVTVAQTASSLLALCVASLIIPTVFHNMLEENGKEKGTVENAKKNAELSRGTAVILLFVYGCYLYFQLKSHIKVYNAPSQKVPKHKSSRIKQGKVTKEFVAMGTSLAAVSRGGVNAITLPRESIGEADHEDEITKPQLTPVGALVTLTISTVLVAFCSDFMVSSIQGVTETGAISTTFVGLILLPVVGNAAEHATAITVAMKDKMDLSVGVAVGSSMQIALLVLPLVVVLGWILNKQCMSLFFDTFQIATLLVSVLLVNYLIQDGKSHWLEGILLMSSYVIIALAAWYYPDIEETQC